jgi:hypothetical protein
VETIADILPELTARASRERHEAVLFHFTFATLQVRGIFFSRSLTMTLGIAERSVGWQCDVSSGGLSEWIPNEAYQAIRDTLVNRHGEYTNRPFFQGLKQALVRIASMDGNSARGCTDAEILALLANCRTADRKYDPDGKRPFFDHWRRVKPSAESLRKIQRHFGQGVREACYLHKVTGVWASEPKDASLQFLTPDEAVHEVAATGAGR